jgi:hypothetical protein
MPRTLAVGKGGAVNENVRRGVRSTLIAVISLQSRTASTPPQRTLGEGILVYKGDDTSM